MRKIHINDLEKKIQSGHTKAILTILRQGRVRTYRRRPRDPAEQAILDRLCMNSWKKALATGKVRILNRNEWYYDLD